MTYVVSDLHGNLKKWQKLLQEINFNETDEMYILGDILDRGERPIKLMLDIKKHSNVHCIMGNHELMFLKIFSKFILHGVSDFRKNIFKAMLFDDWKISDGVTTIDEFCKLSMQKQYEILQYVEKMPLYREITVSGTKYLLTHSALGNFEQDKKIEQYTPSQIVCGEFDEKNEYFDDKTLIFGHTPTFLIDEKCRGKIYTGKNFINVNCNTCQKTSDILGCIRLQDGKEFYV
ncbi:MAG: metallophosphoesterase [Clostridia bacterium]